uniref:SecY-independent transporter protein n=1 Tax=Halamphora calidilacuna TaxID=2133758 RepID=A0A2R4A3M6_9STRA|nr:SecY-independent transporter protein [Halamphora calidilacuna]
MLQYFLELRNKSILLMITFFSTLLICYWYKEMLLFLVTQMHLNDENFYFIFTDVTELFVVYFKVIFLIAFQVSLWYFLYHLFSFLATALYLHELKFISFLGTVGTIFWFLSILLSSYFIIPFSWNFFLSFQSQHGFYFEARISEYLKFYTDTYILCLVYCQFVTLFFIFSINTKQNYSYIKKYRKLYFYAFLLCATLMTPPDLASQLFTTFFLMLTYESVVLFSIFNYYLT